ncbi:HNH endonuclease [Halopseudomonas nanhaiensis]|uniref:HNH endonuclease n=1 Tax=Halopseudomonas nanhaiensis TaxID=2830842 RepID=UPI001CC192F6|nr:HNH endonuclease [Halopseudomonas nanhaiensis]UAW99808.1 HNH endonuclease [Halopseudomonas nanhaiensis]
MANIRWTVDELKLAFYLYCQLPFGQLHRGNQEIINLAARLGRTPSSVAMKLSNFASLDPVITGTGRKGLSGTSQLDRLIWDQFHDDWQSLVDDCSALLAQAGEPLEEEDLSFAQVPADYEGLTRETRVKVRVRQRFFRKAVLAGYRGKCCMSGTSEPRLLNASHISPWSVDPANRLNPANGLCLSALHDRAFDQGLIALTDEHTVLVSDRLKKAEDSFIKSTLVKLEGAPIELPDRFLPAGDMVRWHRENVFQAGN